MDDEEILGGPLKPFVTDEEKETYRYKRPTFHKIAFERRVMQVDKWIARKGIVTKSDVIRYIRAAFDMNEREAKTIYKVVEEHMRRLDKLY